jgi:hypothetical protein
MYGCRAGVKVGVAYGACVYLDLESSQSSRAAELNSDLPHLARFGLLQSASFTRTRRYQREGKRQTEIALYHIMLYYV